MDTFQKSVLIIALFVLIALLISVGILLNKHSKNTNWPPTQNTCPDYWTEGTNTEGTNGICTVGDLNKGNNSKQNTAEVKDSTRCEKRDWAIDNGIMWSGVSNYNGCD